MQSQKPGSIEIIGLLVIIFSALITFSNTMGALAFSAIGMGENQNDDGTGGPMAFILSNYLVLCVGMILIGVLFLIGGIYIRKYKLWANKLVSGLSILIILLIWGLMLAMAITTSKQEGMQIFSLGAILNALIWSSPLGLLIWYLNKKKIRPHFE